MFCIKNIKLDSLLLLLITLRLMTIILGIQIHGCWINIKKIIPIIMYIL